MNLLALINCVREIVQKNGHLIIPVWFNRTTIYNYILTDDTEYHTDSTKILFQFSYLGIFNSRLKNTPYGLFLNQNAMKVRIRIITLISLMTISLDHAQSVKLNTDETQTGEGLATWLACFENCHLNFMI